jgi:hypothetical protein
MKITKIGLWILGIGFFVIAAAVMVALHANQSGDAKQMEENLVVTQSVLNTLIANREELTSQLAQMENQLDEVEIAYNQSKTNFPKTAPSIEYDEEIFSIAHDNDLEVWNLTAAEPRENKVADITFDNTTFEVEVRGTVSNILNFIDDVANGEYFESSTVEMVTMEVPKPGQEEKPAAIIKIIIYSYRGG